MRILIDRGQLLSSLKLVGQAVADRTTNPILSMVLITAQDSGRITFQATDQEIGIACDMDGAEVPAAGSVVVQPQRFISLLREVDDERVEIFSDDSTVRLKTTSGKFQFPFTDPASFPVFPTISEDEPSFAINANDLATAIERTKFAADRTEVTARWSVTGTLMEIDHAKILRVIATDTRRLALSESPITTNRNGRDLNSGQKSLIPPKAIQLLASSLAGAGEPVQVWIDDKSGVFKTARATIHTRLLEGRFPPYRDIIPKHPVATIPLPIDQFLSCVRQVSVMVSDESRRVGFAFAKNLLTLTADNDSESGSGEVTMEIEHDGDEVAAMLDPFYVLGMLKASEFDSLRVEMTGPAAPVVFRSGDSYLYLVMPLSG